MNKNRQRTEIGGDNGFEAWGGYMAAKKSKLQEQFHDQAKKLDSDCVSDIFKNVSVFVNGYTVPSADEIKRIMMQHSGVYHHYFSTEHTSHIIATNLPDVKIKQLKSLHVNVVKPDWITACLKAGHQVDFRPFLLYSHQSRAQPSIRAFAGTVSVNKHVNDTEKPGDYISPEKLDSYKCKTEQESSDRESGEDLFASPEEKQVSKALSNTSPSVKQASDQTVESSKGSSVARSATDPNFLSEFYENSRLHHISTMGATFKQLVYDMRQKKNHNFSGIARLRDWRKENVGVTPSPKNDVCEDDDDFGSSLDVTPKTEHPNSANNKIIMHIDMDCFFVSVGLRKCPHLKGKPIAVTHSKGNGPVNRHGADRKYEFNYYKERLEAKLKNKSGVQDDVGVKAKLAWTDGIDETDSMAEIASCSYEARRKGVKNGMFVGAALKLCPDLKFIPYDFEGYQEVATALYNIVASFTLDIEAVSCDEMFVNCTDILRKTECSVLDFATFLRKEIKEKTDCPASTGFGSNRLLARLATRKAKPDGIFHLEPSMVEDYMRTVNVKDLPGVGRTLTSQLQGMGIFTCGDLQDISHTELSETFKGSGTLLHSLCRGHDNKPLVYDHHRKSVSAEVNYGIRFQTHQEVDVFIRQLSIEVQSRLADAKVKGSCITLKLLVRAKDAPTETAKFMGHGVCDSFTRSATIPQAVFDADTIAREVLQILRKLKPNPSDLRGIGIQITKLESLKNTSTGAMDKFVLKNTCTNLASNSSGKHVEPSSNSKTETSVQKLSPKKSKVFSKKGSVGIDHFMVARKKTTRKDNVVKLPAPADVDLEVLHALPEEIRNEVLEAMASHQNTNLNCPPNELQIKEEDNKDKEDNTNQPSKLVAPSINMDISYSQVDQSFLDALPADMRHELEVEFHQCKVQKELARELKLPQKYNPEQPGPSHLNKRLFCLRNKSILGNFVGKPRDVKELIRQWISQEKEPQLCDIHILEHYLCDLVHEKCIDDLHIILKFFRRTVVSNTNSLWKERFCDILSTVQESMQLEYHSSLHIDTV